jgi:hypothetical protein
VTPSRPTSLGYDIDGVTVSDFVLPEWFMSRPPVLKGGYSHGGHVTRPFELAKGGYISIFRDGRWTQLFAEQQQGVELSDEEKHVTGAHYAVPDARPRVGSRRERRATGPLRWHRSIA